MISLLVITYICLAHSIFLFNLNIYEFKIGLVCAYLWPFYIIRKCIYLILNYLERLSFELSELTYFVYIYIYDSINRK